MPRELIVTHHLARQMHWSAQTFGPNQNTRGILNHIMKELVEIQATGGKDLMEWIDVIILACDGALRAGFTPQEISDAWEDKQCINEQRTWPSWWDVPPDEPIEHIKE